MTATKADTAPPLPLLIRLIDRTSGAVAILAGLAVVLLIVTVTIDVVGRTLFRSPLAGTLEMTAYWWMPMITLLAFAFTEKGQEHIKVTILLDALPLRMRQLVEGSFGLLTIALLLLLAWFALQEALYAAEIGKTTPSRPPVTVWPFYFVAVAGIGLLALQVVATTWRCFAGLPARA